MTVSQNDAYPCIVPIEMCHSNLDTDMNTELDNSYD